MKQCTRKTFNCGSMEFLEVTAREIIGKCRRETIAPVDGEERPVIVYVPGGDNKYPSFWIRDAVMQCAAGIIPIEEMSVMLDIILSQQNDKKTRALKNGLRILPWAFADHINLPGLGECPPGPVFYPGTYSPSDNQGTGVFGNVNVADSPYEVIELAYLICSSIDEDHKQAAFLKQYICDISRIDRLELSLASVNIDPDTGLHLNKHDCWAAEGFHDPLTKYGFALLSSCMRCRALKRMVKLFRLLGNNKQSQQCEDASKQISQSISMVFSLKDGWLMVATEIDRQADVWSTSLSIYEDILDKETEDRAIKAMLEAYLQGTVAYKGYLRHTPTTYDAIPGKQVWEDGRGTWRGVYGTYTAGGYWPQATGWYVFALSKRDVESANRLANEFIDHTVCNLDKGAPFEWISPSMPLADTPGLGRWYGPSIALPLSAFRRTFKQ